MALQAPTPPPPYYAVIFYSQRTSEDEAGYAAAAERMETLAATMPGYLGIESVRNAEGFGITVSYWESEAAILHWRHQAEHLEAQRLGKECWYAAIEMRICRVERAYGFRKNGEDR